MLVLSAKSLNERVWSEGFIKILLNIVSEQIKERLLSVLLIFSDLGIKFLQERPHDGISRIFVCEFITRTLVKLWRHSLKDVGGIFNGKIFKGKILLFLKCFLVGIKWAVFQNTFEVKQTSNANPRL